MNKERLKILGMLVAGKITIDEADQLFDAIEKRKGSQPDETIRLGVDDFRPSYLIR